MNALKVDPIIITIIISKATPLFFIVLNIIFKKPKLLLISIISEFILGFYMGFYLYFGAYPRDLLERIARIYDHGGLLEIAKVTFFMPMPQTSWASAVILIPMVLSKNKIYGYIAYTLINIHILALCLFLLALSL